MVVNAPGNPRQGRWLELCLRMVSRHTQWPNYRVYVWNNDPEADWLRPFLLADVHATLLDSVPVEGMTAGPASINHALALQQLYERARTDGAEYVVTLDSDAHPLRKGWLTYLLSSLRDDTVLAGVWRDELRDAIDPYLHASCLCTTVEFIEKNGLRFDKIDTAGPARSDTLSSFTDAAINTGAGIHKLRRSNKRQFHRVMGGIYGDVVYHHGAGSRPNISFWGDKEAPATFKENRALWDLATKLLFESYDDYIEYLRGSDSRTRYPTSAGVVLMLGMHRSGTSCLAGCLENAGLNLGAASSNNDNQPRGNRELRQKDLATETMLASNGGNWRNPPSEVTLSDDDRHSILDAVGTLRQREPCGLKDPRVLLMADAWFAMIPDARPIGCFRHPRSVAASLMARDGMSTDEALALWNEYNLKLVALHRERHFPLVEFDLSNYTDYLCSVLDVARSLALNDNPICIGSAVIAEADHHTATQTDVPETCAGTYEYLRNNKFRGNAVERRFVVSGQIGTRNGCRRVDDEPVCGREHGPQDCSRKWTGQFI
jgi:hypothetical protein